MNEIMRKAKDMQTNLSRIQEELSKATVEGSSGGGMVRAVCTGNQVIQSISIDKSVVGLEDIEMLQDLILAAVNEALRLSKEVAETEMRTLTGGINLPFTS